MQHRDMCIIAAVPKMRQPGVGVVVHSRPRHIAMPMTAPLIIVILTDQS